MKKIIIAILFMFLQGCSSDIDTVKGSILSFDESLTIEQAFDGWKACDSTDWVEIEGKRGDRIVRYDCEADTDGYFERLMELQKKLVKMASANGKGPNNVDFLNVESSTISVHFAMKNDESLKKNDSFFIKDITVSYEWEDGTFVTNRFKHDSILSKVYNDQKYFSPSELDNRYKVAGAGAVSIFRNYHANAQKD